MNKRTMFLLFCAMFVMAGIAQMNGCASLTEKKIEAQSYATLDASAGAIQTLLENKQISVDTADKLYKGLKVATELTNAWDDARLTGNQDLIQKTGAAAKAGIQSFNDLYKSSTGATK